MKHCSLHSSTVADVSPEEVLVSSQVLPTSSLKATDGYAVTVVVVPVEVEVTEVVVPDVVVREVEVAVMVEDVVVTECRRFTS